MLHNIIYSIFFSDNVAAMHIKSWDVDCSLFDGDLMAGPIPLLFSEDHETAATNIKADPLKAHWDLMKIARCFFLAESLSLQEAIAYVKKPRYNI